MGKRAKSGGVIKTSALAMQVTLFSKTGGPLTKRIRLIANGSVESDGSACVMARGVAKRVTIGSVKQLADLITKLKSNQAIALGRLRNGLRKTVRVTTKSELNGKTRTNVIARTGDDVVFHSGQHAFVLIDFDAKGMPSHVEAAIAQHGGLWSALVSVLPSLAHVAHVIRRSTSAGLYRSDSGKKIRGSNGLHIYLLIQDGTDSERFLRTLHDLCWLAGLGWMTIGAGGQLLERSIVDRMVGRPERLVFEGPPILKKPLKQDRASRKPIAHDGDVLDTRAACHDLTMAEKTALETLKAGERERLAPESRRVRAEFIEIQAKRLAERTGMTEQLAKHTIYRQCEGILLPSAILPFDEDELAGCTVADVLADPSRFEGRTLADPLEGVSYGRCKAKILCRADGAPWIHSFAHGRTIYELRYDAAAVRHAVDAALEEDVIRTFVELAVNADLDPMEMQELRHLVQKRSNAGLRVIDAALEAQQQKLAEQQADARRNRQRAKRRDPRPAIPAPLPDQPWLPQMDILNSVIGTVKDPLPPMRDIDGCLTQIRRISISTMHAFTPGGANSDQEDCK